MSIDHIHNINSFIYKFNTIFAQLIHFKDYVWLCTIEPFELCDINVESECGEWEINVSFFPIILCPQLIVYFNSFNYIISMELRLGIGIGIHVCIFIQRVVLTRAHLCLAP